MRRGMPLSFVIARYFAYAFLAVAATWLIAFMALSASITMGYVIEASWGPAHAREVASELAEARHLNTDEIPTAYRYLIADADGAILATDLEGTRLDRAKDAADTARTAAAGDITVEGAGSGLTIASVSLRDGSACVLVSEYLPQWTSRTLAETLPNPQNLMLAAGIAGSAVALALVARRASRVIARKMGPLADAAARIGREELDFAVGHTNVREINEILGAMDTMRASLAESLEARWEAERSQREQVASLAHDLKTPLTVLRANADFVAEEFADAETITEMDKADLAAAARDIATGTERLDAYVRLLIEASRGAHEAQMVPVQPDELCRRCCSEAESVARAHALKLVCCIDPALSKASCARLDPDALARAVENLVTNAAEHARTRMHIACTLENSALVIEVSDDGPGFSPAALEHGCDRLFSDDASRSTADGAAHYGLGLYTAAEVARIHGGAVTLSNRMCDDGTAGGGVATITIPLDTVAPTTR